MDIEIRTYRSEDADRLAEVYHRAVREGAGSHYTEAERAAWSPEAPTDAAWTKRLAENETVLAVNGDGTVGFMSMTHDAHIDLAFVLPEYQRRGVAGMLYAVLEGRARAAGWAQLTTHASLVAEALFAAKGFRVVEREEVERNSVVLKRALMEKRLTCTQEPKS